MFTSLAVESSHVVLSSSSIRPGCAPSLLLRPCSLRCKAFSAFSPLRTQGNLASVLSSRGIRHASKAVETVAPTTPAAPADGKPVPSQAYPFTEIEAKWQAYWEQEKTFRTPDQVDTSKPKYYVLDMFPYPRFANSDLLS